jgi:hypothetical protein
LPRGIPCRPFPELARSVHDDVGGHLVTYPSLNNVP